MKLNTRDMRNQVQFFKITLHSANPSLSNVWNIVVTFPLCVDGSVLVVTYCYCYILLFS